MQYMECVLLSRPFPSQQRTVDVIYNVWCFPQIYPIFARAEEKWRIHRRKVLLSARPEVLKKTAAAAGCRSTDSRGERDLLLSAAIEMQRRNWWRRKITSPTENKLIDVLERALASPASSSRRSIYGKKNSKVSSRRVWTAVKISKLGEKTPCKITTETSIRVTEATSFRSCNPRILNELEFRCCCCCITAPKMWQLRHFI